MLGLLCEVLYLCCTCGVRGGDGREDGGGYHGKWKGSQDERATYICTSRIAGIGASGISVETAAAVEVVVIAPVGHFTPRVFFDGLIVLAYFGWVWTLWLRPWC